MLANEKKIEKKKKRKKKRIIGSSNDHLGRSLPKDPALTNLISISPM